MPSRIRSSPVSIRIPRSRESERIISLQPHRSNSSRQFRYIIRQICESKYNQFRLVPHSCLPLAHRIDWEIIGHALNRPSQLNMRGTAPSGGVFAPCLRYHEQSRTYYMITTWFDIISPPDVRFQKLIQQRYTNRQ